MQERIFNQVAQLVECLVIAPRFSAIFTRGYDCFRTLCLNFIHDGIAIVAFIGE